MFIEKVVAWNMHNDGANYIDLCSSKLVIKLFCRNTLKIQGIFGTDIYCVRYGKILFLFRKRIDMLNNLYLRGKYS